MLSITSLKTGEILTEKEFDELIDSPVCRFLSKEIETMSTDDITKFLEKWVEDPDILTAIGVDVTHSVEGTAAMLLGVIVGITIAENYIRHV